jgi:hypothetical protein
MLQAEAVVSSQSSLVSTLANLATNSWYIPQRLLEWNWDYDVEYPRIFGRTGLLGCDLDFSESDGG